MSGVLNGNGLRSFCTVSAVRVALSGTRLYKNCRYSILWVANSLPDGKYLLLVDGDTVQMCLSSGDWQATRM
jgi:hypothetical protein